MKILRADLDDASHQTALLDLLDRYCQDPMGNGKPLDEEVRQRLIPGLRKHPTTIIFLAYIEERPVGLANCFLGFSTFAAKTLLTLHDLTVLPEVRGMGVGRALLQAVEVHAKQLGCCKLTLEVLEQNLPAKKLYESVGFRQMDYGQGAGGAIFMTKPID